MWTLVTFSLQNEADTWVNLSPPPPFLLPPSQPLSTHVTFVSVPVRGEAVESQLRKGDLLCSHLSLLANLVWPPICQLVVKVRNQVASRRILFRLRSEWGCIFRDRFVFASRATFVSAKDAEFGYILVIFLCVCVFVFLENIFWIIVPRNPVIFYAITG